jgi:protein-tyrosine-phosphatase
MKKNILFICNGNIHRSVIAAEIFKKILKKHNLDQQILVNSYGIQGTGGTRLPKYKHLSEYPKEWNAAKLTLQKLELDISKHTFQKISKIAMKRATVVIAMDNKVYLKSKNSLVKQFPNQIYKIHQFSELTLHHKEIKDLAGNDNADVHKEIIENIYIILNKNFKDILDWANKL